MEAKNSTELVIPERYTTIRKYAFSRCKGLTSITIPDSVIKFHNHAFGWRNEKFEFHVPSESMANYLVNRCGINRDKIKVYQNRSPGSWVWYPDENGTINIPNGVEIKPSMFSGREDIRGINIPYGVETIASHAFSGCKRLTSITIPNSVTSIGNFAFL